MANYRSLIVLLCCFQFISLSTQAQSKPPADSVEVMKALDYFIDAFTSLKWSEFSSCFADDATAFFPPSAHVPKRASNKKEIEEIFKRVFDNARKGKTGPPYLDIHPEDIRIQMAGD